MKAFLLKCLLLIIVLFAAGFFLLFMPDNLREVYLKGKTIKIDRDHYGIATIHVASIEELLYAMGTIYAEDRLFQIAMRVYSVQGRLSEFLGERPL
jgi:acyl-homoserine lactone acylase PvdQ